MSDQWTVSNKPVATDGLQSSIEQLGKLLDETKSLVFNLTERLEPLLLSRPEADLKKEPGRPPSPVRSRAVVSLQDCVVRVQTIQTALAEMTQNLNL